MDSKRCFKCKSVLPVAEFNRNRASRDGFQASCRPCSRDIRKLYEARHAEAIQLRHAEKLAREVGEDTETKVCRSCGETKPKLSFYAHRSTLDGRANYCSECAKHHQREWNNKNRERIREGNARRRSDPATLKRYNHQRRRKWLQLYGLTPGDYNALLESQGGTCAICGQPGQTWGENNLHVDHDHDTDEVRGLLCGKCNVGIGMLGDNAESIRRALAYLEKPPAMNSDVREVS